VNRFAVKLERFIAAPRAKVYRAFLDPAVLAQWFCPDGSAVVVADVDARVGGVHRIEMLSDEGVHHMFDSVIEQLVPDERIVLTFKFHPEGEETLFTVSFRDVDGGTDLTLEHERITLMPPMDTQSVETGWGGALRKLQALYDKE
jgi:uncharacterized protein YndB with AHSA1/START domain